MTWTWRGRDDGSDPAAQRWHQVIKPWDAIAHARGRRHPMVVIGYPTDAGVRANFGRGGAVEGPLALRAACANLPAPTTHALFDAGDVSGGGDDVETWQRALSAAVAAVRAGGGIPVILGGGHDQAFGHWLGTVHAASEGSIVGCINFDSHIDMRPLLGGRAHSGTPYSQVQQWCAAHHRPFKYLLLGMQQTHNTPALIQSASAGGGQLVDADAFHPGQEASLLQLIDRFIATVDHVCLSVDLDVFSAAVAPGVSAPSPMGIIPDATFRTIIRRIASSGKIAGIEIAECAPCLDVGGRTARLGAAVIDTIVRSLPLVP
ncbi:MAG: formimidoylglutamase [Phycisphaerales bacterium]|nr:formimidoylglutamase [Phycisphaerales bacterium]